MARQASSALKRPVLVLAALLALAVPATGAAASHAIALFPSASSPDWEGFARIINHTDESGTVRVTGIDDAGIEHGTVELMLDAQATAHFNSADLEEGNPDKGLAGALGEGEGEWRLRLESELAIEVLSYIRTGDGFVTAMREVVPAQGRYHHVRFFNPGSNTSQVSRLRLINSGDEEVEVTIEGRDDAGEPAPGGEVSLTLAPGEGREVSAQALEEGGDGLVEGLGEGSGKWQLFVSADGDIEVMSLLESPTGHLSNLSAPGLRDFSEGKRELGLPLFLSASDAEREGFARLLNHSEASGTVRIYGVDDAGVWSGPVVLTLASGAAAHFNSGDLERGNEAKGLAGALGAGTGSWRLRLYSELDLEAFAYVRTLDGFVTTMHERVRESAMRHHVVFFNPGSNASQVSRLRLINPGEDAVEVTIAGRDDDGEPAPGGEVRLTLGAGEARMLTAQALESGGDGLAGSLGDGMGKWQLFVSAESAIEVMSLLRSPTGHLANLSVAGVAGIVSEEGLDEPVALEVIVDIPSEVTTMRAGELETTVLGSETDAAPPGGASALLVASDAGGAVMYALVNEDGGLLGEERGTVRVSVASTAVVLVALAAGYRIPSVTPEVVAAILSHAEFGALRRALVRLMSADKNYLTRLSDYPDVVAVTRRMAGSVSDGGASALKRAGRSAADARAIQKSRLMAHQALVHGPRRRKVVDNRAISGGDARQLRLLNGPAADARSALPDGIVKENFYCTPLTGWPCSPWDEHEPWRWFGNARGAEAYYPDGTSWKDLFLALVPYVEAYHDFLEEAQYPPFLARSDAEDARAVHAAANPSFVGYAMELYEGSQLRGWYYVPGNATTVDKLRNSGAAFREVLAGDGLILGPDIDRVRFQRYRLRAATDGWLPDRALVVSFLNTFHLLSSIANMVTDFSAVDGWLRDIAEKPYLYFRIASCASAFPERHFERDDPNRPVTERMLAFFRDNGPSLFGRLLANEACRSLVVEMGGEKLVGLLRNLIGPAALDTVASVLSLGLFLVDSANEVVPGAVSYFAPKAARSEYHVQWERTRGGQAYIARVSEEPLPVAEFTYAQQRGFRVELDGSRSEGEGLRYEWAVAGARIGTGEELVHDFGEAGAFEVTLTVTDRHGVTADERGRVRVAPGRVPVVSSLTCTPTGEGKAFSMHAELSDADNDIDTVEWYSSISNTSPDRETGAGTGSVTLSAPGDASYTRAKVRVVDERGNEAERNCEVVFDSGPPAPRIADVSAEEGEALTFTVTLDRAPDEAVMYYYATYRASARSDDFDGHFATALHFARGERTKPVTVQTTEDTRVEPDETVYLYLTETTGELVFSGLPVSYLARAAGTILDDDEAGEAAPAPRIADAGAEEGEALTFTVTLDRAPDEAVTYYYATYRASARSEDYDGHFATALRFAAGERTKTITVQTTEDARVEGDETFLVYLTESPGDLTASAPTRYLARATGTIRDDDGQIASPCLGPTVDIPDAALRRVVEAALDKTYGAPITPAEMLNLGSLYGGAHDGIEHLTGLQCARALEWLAFSVNQISDLSPLAGLTALEVLYLWDNQISDLSPLAGLTALEELYLWHNQISDLSPLAGLTALRVLELPNNQISDLSPLAGLTVLEELRLGVNQISDLSPLAGLTALEVLRLSANQISDFSPLAGLTVLEELGLGANQISDFSPLAGLTALEKLALHANQISDLSPLAGLTALEVLTLFNNSISDLSPLAGLTALEGLTLFNNSISDLSPLAGLTALEMLELSANQISDLSPLAGLTALEMLELSANQISDLGPLVLNAGLGDGDEVNLKSNPLSARSLQEHVPALQARGVSVYHSR